MASIRYVNKFEYSPGNFYTFPLSRYEYEPSQDLVLASSPLSGGNYAYDLQGSSRSPKRNSIHRLRFLDRGTAAEINADVDDLRAQLYEGVQGKVWTTGTLVVDEEETEVERWAYGRIATMPSYQLSVENKQHIPAFVTFECSSDFYAAEAEEQTFEAPGSITVNNPGSAPVYNAILTLKGTFTDPRIENLTNGYAFESTRDGAGSDDWLQLLAPRRVRFSSNGGSSWSGDYANVTRNQVQQMVLEPGANSLVVTGASGATLVVSFYPAWH